MTAIRLGVSMASVLASLTLLPAAMAQSTTADPAAQTADPDQPRDIIVTAQKREQLLIDVPQSVSVVSGDMLERQQATNFKDYLKLVPGLQLNQSTPGFGRLVLRGLNTGGVASTVAVYQDETIFGSSTGLVNGGILAGDFDTFDVARIEVLRGPQGTLYGANALGGILKFVTNTPDTSKVEARGRASVETTKGGGESYMGSAVINLPVSDTLAVRASGFYRDIGGFIDSIGTAGSDVEKDINSSKSYGGRASVLFKPVDEFSIQLSAYVQNLDVDASDSIDAERGTGKTSYGRLSQSQFTPEFADIRYRVYSGLINYDLGFASLVSATSYSTLRQRYRSDFSPAYSPIIEGAIGLPNDFFQDQETKVDRFTQEVRLESADSDVFEWIVGGFYTREKGLIEQDFTAATPGTVTPIAGLPLLGTARLASRYREVAGFANGTLHVGEHFDLTFGGRYSHNKQRADSSSDGLLVNGATVLPTARSSEGVFTYSVAPKFKIDDNVSVYARVAKGFRPGGPNSLAPGAPPELRSFDSDTVISYEAGIKAQTADRKFSIDAAAFRVDWDNIQVFGSIGVFNLNFNGDKARSQGFEFTAIARPTRGFAVSFNGAYTDAKLRDDTPIAVGGFAGDRLPYTPQYSIAANADYEWSIGADAKAYLGASIRSLSKQPATFDADYRAATGQQPTLAAYEVVDLRAGVNFGRYSLEVYTKNLTNSDGKTSLDYNGNVPFDRADAGVIRPRTIGLTLGAGF
ncbi:TonB-dependent receptor [Sphingomonas hylomeconis]|uniref:TonB-dependent receptor n=1 Tax=Sphingomonas hylomeconis TaxID=1395958 RepID=A0ABV7STT6_9SPHN|nr:TonB-dependent receptor [Sphingomonas hylomeconis]